MTRRHGLPSAILSADAISVAYRSDDGRAIACSAQDVSCYAGWAAELADLLAAGATVADLGSGIGLPVTRALTDHRLRVIGVDFSAVQLATSNAHLSSYYDG